MQTMKKIAQYRNIAVSFDWVIECSLYQDVDGNWQESTVGDEWIRCSDIVDVVFTAIEIPVDAQLDRLDEIEKKIRERHLKEMDESLESVKNRRAALLVLCHDSKDAGGEDMMVEE